MLHFGILALFGKVWYHALMQYRFKYFPVSITQKSWGLYTTCAGHSRTEPGAAFPSRKHPDEYFFTWKSGRVLHEWQIVLVEDGDGVVEFKDRRLQMSKGAFVVLPPESWHRYRPNKSTGWTTLWIGFNGDLATRLVGGAGFNPEGEVRDLPPNHRFHALFKDAVTDILENGRDNVYSTAARIPMLIASIMEDRPDDNKRPNGAETIRRAQAFIIDHSAETVDFASLAESLGIPYRTFRYLFVKECGVPPLQYQLGIRLARAKNLLRSSDMPIAEIAESLGFNSTWYFSHFFRKQTGTSPAAYRR